MYWNRVTDEVTKRIEEQPVFQGGKGYEGTSEKGNQQITGRPHDGFSKPVVKNRVR